MVVWFPFLHTDVQITYATPAGAGLDRTGLKKKEHSTAYLQITVVTEQLPIRPPLFGCPRIAFHGTCARRDVP
ncbi:hypothetical protein RRF57_012238 [Xylaria bambusicola]|uniref:Uncharacterized protein n=1 Tax=Xylaria bambusicola TaxID=326684 RepID=A0AAN7V1I6_9PEZI